ncbi:MAG: porin family protein [Bradyrhizobiaceae bacterium]|nr:MAG: porin family protein [Bradyrhizobiaceae bacterium]
MKKILIAVAWLAATSGVQAADMTERTYAKAPAYAAPVYNWTGFYIGGHVGGVFDTSNGFSTTTIIVTGSHDSSAFMGGGQIGADYQFAPNWVAGIEGQLSALSSYHHRFTDGGGAFRDRNDWLASVTGRFGFTWGPGLIYAKGGVAFRDNGFEKFNSTAPPPMSIMAAGRDGTGYTVGGGLEYLFAPMWSAKVEYQYYGFGTTSVTSNLAIVSTVRYRDDTQSVKAGLNYHFN